MRPRALLLALFLGATALCVPAAIAQDRVVNFATDDAEMNSAIDTARSRLDAFLGYAARQDLGSGAYSVKYAAPVSGGSADTEHIWVTLLQIDGDRLSGVLANQPAGFEGAVGDPVSFATAEVSDWAYWGADGKLHGSYTTRVILPQLANEERAQIEAILAPIGEDDL
ncbi:DUF2314 domain-containing protein [Frigidibacter sp. RF13]|uniref:DUF2314 domain-containing protein n=1 Tax=Frigidibacter sp. RF13 TaxID=2997340 RepID=UPI00226E2AB3|nr:DUF2314 domain-containing protein [Frigidibacter sp. RF13]MCY1127558.1 DUF2314 domain-containing protein [Frigidibacter sp. RF13]